MYRMIVGLAAAALALHYIDTHAQMAGLVGVVSSIDNKTYFVQPTKNSLDASNALARAVESAVRIIDHLDNRVQTAPMDLTDDMRRGVRLLTSKHPHGANMFVSELAPRNMVNAIAANQNKSQSIFICIRKRPPEDTIVSDAHILYVLLHELAHSMCDEYAEERNGRTVHNADFRRKEAYLYQVAFEFGLLNPSTIPGTMMCGYEMPNPGSAM